MTSVHSQKGAALIEALVSALVFAIGVLALLGLQTLAVKATSDGQYRAEAAYMANQIIGDMWADQRTNLPSYAHNCTNTTTGCAPSCNPTSNASVYGRVTSWLSTLTSRFPTNAVSSSRVMISVVPTVGTLQGAYTYQVAVSICWRMPQDPAGQYHNYVAAAQIS